MGRRLLPVEFFQSRTLEDLLLYLTNSINLYDEKDQVIEYITTNFKSCDDLIEPLGIIPTKEEMIKRFRLPEHYGPETKLIDVISDLVSGKLTREENVEVYSYFYKNFKSQTEILFEAYDKIEKLFLSKEEEDKMKFTVLLAMSLSRQIINDILDGTMTSEMNIKFLTNKTLDKFVDFEKKRQRVKFKK